MPLETTSGSDLGIEVIGYHYEEVYNNVFIMSTQGNKVGINGSFTQTLDDNWYWGADARQAHGNVLYHSANTGDKGDNPDVITELRITVGRDIFMDTHYVLSGYFGLGYRELYSDLRGQSTTKNAGYRRISQYTYLPLGLTHRIRLGPRARLAARTEYDYLLEGRQESRLSDADRALPDIVNTQQSGHGVRLHLSYETPNWSFGAFINTWQIDVSNVVSGYIEPPNTTRETGVEWKLHFKD